MNQRVDLTGLRFGKWHVLGFSHSNKRGVANWFAICDCGTERVVVGTNLSHGLSKSCGCSRTGGSLRTHSMCKSRIYGIWSGMLQRCTNPRRDYYENYGGRGIKVCPEWFSFDTFYADMCPTYVPGLSIDRIDNNGDYEPSNCRWATDTQQSRSNRNCKLNPQAVANIRSRLSSGVSKAELARVHGVSESLIRKIADRTIWVEVEAAE